MVCHYVFVFGCFFFPLENVLTLLLFLKFSFSLFFFFALPSVHLNILRLFTVLVFPPYIFLAFASPFLTLQVRLWKIWPLCNSTFSIVNILPVPLEVFPLLGLWADVNCFNILLFWFKENGKKYVSDSMLCLYHSRLQLASWICKYF